MRTSGTEASNRPVRKDPGTLRTDRREHVGYVCCRWSSRFHRSFLAWPRSDDGLHEGKDGDGTQEIQCEAADAVLAAVAVMSTPAAGGSTVTRAAAAEPGPDKATIRYTEYGIPHITASDREGLGTGYGYAAAEDTSAPSPTPI